MVEIAVAIEVVEGWGAGVDRSVIESAVRAAVRIGAEANGAPVSGANVPASVEVSVYLTGDDEMRLLNEEHRGVDRSTDVLSFSFLAEHAGPGITFPTDVPVPLGEVILCGPRAERQAEEIGHSLDTEVAWLTIHGSLQLLGYSHDTEACAERMEALERQALAELGITVD